MKKLTARTRSKSALYIAALAFVAGLSLTGYAGTAVEQAYAAPPIYRVYKAARAQAASRAETSPASRRFGSHMQSPSLDTESHLPTVEERLPLKPLVMEPGMAVGAVEPPRWELGTHGGQLWLMQPTEAEFDSLPFMLSENFLGTLGLRMQGLYGNLAEDFSVHPGNTHFRVTLRQGLKWSDGTPVTTEDVAFTHEEIWQNELLNFMGMPQHLRTAGEAVGSPVSLQVQDDYTFYLSFEEPYGSFLRVLGGTGWFNYADLLKPAHYLKEFHPNYITPERTKELLQERGIRYEWELFGSADCHPHEAREAKCLGFPVLWPWTPHVGPDSKLFLQRNPYYHKIDGAGRQLPYIDRIHLKVGPAANELAASQGTLHDLYLLGHDPAAGARSVPDEDNGLRVSLLQGHASTVTLFLNRTYADETWRSIVSKPEFRQALLLGVDQDSLAELLAPGRMHHFVRPSHGHDPGAARTLLDELGLDQVDDNGWRRTPDGAIFSLPIEYDQNLADFRRIAAKLEGDLQKIGLKSEVLGIDPLVLQARGRANQLRGSLGTLGYPLWESELQNDYLPNDSWGSLWRLWHATDTDKGETPPTSVQRLFELHNAHAQGRAGSPEMMEMALEILRIHDEGQFGLNLVGLATPSQIFSPHLHNLPTQGLAGFALQDSELWFWGGLTE